MFSREKGYKIRVKVHGKGAYFFPNRRAWLPLLKLIAVTGSVAPKVDFLLASTTLPQVCP